MSMPSQQTAFTVNRRSLLKNIGAAGAAAAILPANSLVAGRAFAQEPQGDVIKRPIPRTGEMVPAIGLGTFMTFDVVPGSQRAKIGEVVRLFWEAGGRMFDTSPLYGMSEVNLGDFASALGISGDMFITNKIWSTGDYLADDSHAERSLEVSMERLWRERIDAMQCHSLVNAEIVIPLLNAWKKEERIRFVGASHHTRPISNRSPLGSRVARSISCRCITPSTPAKLRNGYCGPRPTKVSQSSSICRWKRRGFTRSSPVGRCPTSPRTLASKTGRSSS